MEVTFSVFAFRGAEDPPVSDERRYGVPGWRIGEAVEWALGRGHDTVLVQATPGREASSSRLVTHHVCSDSGCPGGCD